MDWELRATWCNDNALRWDACYGRVARSASVAGNYIPGYSTISEAFLHGILDFSMVWEGSLGLSGRHLALGGPGREGGRAWEGLGNDHIEAFSQQLGSAA